jgi:hypothetical protein
MLFPLCCAEDDDAAAVDEADTDVTVNQWSNEEDELEVNRVLDAGMASLHDVDDDVEMAGEGTIAMMEVELEAAAVDELGAEEVLEILSVTEVLVWLVAGADMLVAVLVDSLIDVLVNVLIVVLVGTLVDVLVVDFASGMQYVLMEGWSPLPVGA